MRNSNRARKDHQLKILLKLDGSLTLSKYMLFKPRQKRPPTSNITQVSYGSLALPPDF